MTPSHCQEEINSVAESMDLGEKVREGVDRKGTMVSYQPGGETRPCQRFDSWRDMGEPVRQALERGEVLHRDTASEEITDEFLLADLPLLLP
jgi:hypothetical protein